MPTLLHRIESIVTPEERDNRVRWTRQECAQLVEAGIVEAEKYELLGGELFVKVKNRPHINATNLLLHFLNAVFGDLYVQSQDPIGVAPIENETNAPEPDAAVTRQPVASYTESDPGPEELRLVVEVTDSTQNRDKVVKSRLYATAGIPEYWILDLRARKLRVHRNPDTTTGEYKLVQEYNPDETIAPLAAPNSVLTVIQLLPTE
jgi:Uma2 family endonuclease